MDRLWMGWQMNKLVIAIAASVLTACSTGSPPTVASIESSDTAEGSLLRAIKSADHVLYGEVSAKAQAALETKELPLRAVASARNEYYRALLKRLPWLSDDQALLERSASLERLRYLLEHNALACAHASVGDSGPAVSVLPEEMLRTEMARVAEVINVDMSRPPLPSLTDEEMSAVIFERFDSNPERHPAVRLLNAFRNLPPPRPYPTEEDAIAMCRVNIAAIEDTLFLPVEMQPRYQRAIVRRAGIR
jgi:hypothetical protein